MQFTLFAIALAAIVTPSLAIPTQSQANPLIQPRYTCAPTRYLPSPKCKYYNWLYKPCLSTVSLSSTDLEEEELTNFYFRRLAMMVNALLSANMTAMSRVASRKERDGAAFGDYISLPIGLPRVLPEPLFSFYF
ncbi:hypothetical protein MBM_04857 [Drepanopeziza brunnea f. sp. 'multigermtubi' MB_m1]|uniref:Uncharacterized protein n=1 Tax=Marssonina brunnea f. sp. multigermtubi (strain MB_m1) TaxID=1072389 RepID=K1WI54_MARBU|nr:uncharacterized protein MBM_04857 [Drepanopeziza brunnea f. sp. 'multigermtubi' MB_m1]EKD17280.1 hypothetical protein MBM_04857 [Drepanopeziza brunnea f. sp. 'multigermtubi' MB_m1]